MLTSGQRDWLRVRSYLQEHRHELTLDAAADFPADRRIAGTPLLGAPGWLPPEPVPLQDIALDFTPPPDLASPSPARPSPARPSPARPSPSSPGPSSPAESSAVLPDRSDGGRYLRYSDAIRDLAAPAVFENRSTYRLTRVELTGRVPRLGFSRGRYFDGIDTGEAAAHEYAAGRLAHPDGRPDPAGRRAGLRGAIGDPCDLRRRPANLAISTLTLRLDRPAGRTSFLLHWRDPAKVGHAGGLYQVIPVGVFQPSGEAAWNEQPDFSLWRSMIREFAEELRGRSEDYDSETRPVDYDSWPFARRMTEALDRGQIRVWCLGLGVDPLTYAADLLTVAVVDSAVFDELFSRRPRRNEEGRVLAPRDFAAPVIDRLVTRDPVQAAGAAVLRLAWAHRDTLTG
ncbi:MAG: transcriptional regulator [Actinomycetota bacterium]|nr:transcriptional regulator [Actinomycetota bacterium]